MRITCFNAHYYKNNNDCFHIHNEQYVELPKSNTIIRVYVLFVNELILIITDECGLLPGPVLVFIFGLLMYIRSVTKRLMAANKRTPCKVLPCNSRTTENVKSSRITIRIFVHMAFHSRVELINVQTYCCI